MLAVHLCHLPSYALSLQVDTGLLGGNKLDFGPLVHFVMGILDSPVLDM